MRIAIVQSNYIPWRGYFDLIRNVDLFVLFDSVQFTRRDWRNRNQIKTSNGKIWLTIPVLSKGRYLQPIDETLIDGHSWIDDHLQAIRLNYARAACFAAAFPPLAECYGTLRSEKRLSAVNERLLRHIADAMGIRTPFTRCTDLVPRGELLALDPNARLIALCRAAGANRYLSGPAARSYLDEGLFRTSGVAVEWADYSGYLDYTQRWGEFDGFVSAIDLLLNVGADAPRYLKNL